MPEARNVSIAAWVDGMLAPSEMQTQPFLSSSLASSSLTSFWVALGKAAWQGTLQTLLRPVG